MSLREAAQQALEAIDRALPHAPHHSVFDVLADCADDLRAALAKQAMDDAITAGDGVLMNEQAALLRECRHALDYLLRDKPMLAAKHCGTTTLGNLRAMLYEYRPQGVFGGRND